MIKIDKSVLIKATLDKLISHFQTINYEVSRPSCTLIIFEAELIILQVHTPIDYIVGSCHSVK